MLDFGHQEVFNVIDEFLFAIFLPNLMKFGQKMKEKHF